MLFVPIAIIALLVIIFLSSFNSLSRKKADVERAEGTVSAMLKKRHELIPNLVECTNALVVHEKVVVGNLVNLYDKLEKHPAHDQQYDLENQLTQIM